MTRLANILPPYDELIVYGLMILLCGASTSLCMTASRAFSWASRAQIVAEKEVSPQEREQKLLSAYETEATIYPSLYSPAQKISAKPYKVALAIILSDVPILRVLKGFIDALKASTTIPLTLRIFNADRDPLAVRAEVEEALSWGCDLLVTCESIVSQLAKEVREKRGSLVPQVFLGTGDPVRLGLVASPDRPGGTITGASICGDSWAEGMVSRVIELFPHTRSVLIPYCPSGLGGSLDHYAGVYKRAFERAGIKVRCTQMYKQSDVVEILSAYSSPRAYDLIVLLPDGLLLENLPFIRQIAARIGAPVCVSFNLGEIFNGATFAYGYREQAAGAAGAHKALEALFRISDIGDIPVDTLSSHYKALINADTGVEQGFERVIDHMLFALTPRRTLTEGAS